jgi:hypothetical protein
MLLKSCHGLTINAVCFVFYSLYGSNREHLYDIFPIVVCTKVLISCAWSGNNVWKEVNGESEISHILRLPIGKIQ